MVGKSWLKKFMIEKFMDDKFIVEKNQGFNCHG